METYKNKDYLIEAYETKKIREIAEECGVGSTTISVWMKRFNIPTTTKHYKTLKKGDIKIKRGYRYIFDPDCPHSHKDGWVYEHILIALQEYGTLPENFNIHHIDGDKLNNDISNLFLCSVSEHTKLHRKMEQLVLELYKQRKVIFKDGAYISREV